MTEKTVKSSHNSFQSRRSLRAATLVLVLLLALLAGEEGRRWAPRPGSYELALVDNYGTMHDAVSFVVRGNVTEKDVH